MTEAIATVALLAAVVACVAAYRAHTLAQRAANLRDTIVAIIESRSSRTVVCDLSDGRITVIKEIKDAEPREPIPDIYPLK